MSPVRYRLLDMQRAITAIENFVVGGETVFRQSMQIQHAVFHDLTVLGEAARAIPREVRDRYPHVPWPQIVALRNAITHEYHRLRLELIWGVVRDELPKLKRQIEVMLADHPQ